MAKRVKQPHGGELNMLQPGETANPNGRPPKLVNKIIREYKERGFEEVSKTHVREAYQMLLGLTEKEIIKIQADKDAPMLLRIVAQHMTGDKNFEIVEKLLDRSHGKATQSTEVAVTVEKAEYKLPDGTVISL